MTASKLDSHWQLLHPSDYLHGPDLRGRDVRVRIADVSRQDLNMEGRDDKMPKVVITFEGKDKKYVASKTTLRLIHAYLGTGLTAEWIGKYVWLHPTKNEWRAKTKDWTGKQIRNPQTGLVDDAVRVWPIEPPNSRATQRAPGRSGGPPSPAPEPAPAAEPEPYDGPPADWRPSNLTEEEF